MKFKSNKIFLDSETVAEQLRSARQAKNVKLKEAAQRLNISHQYLEALEKGNFTKLPAGIYGKNFLREYALFLGLDYNELAKIFEKERDLTHNPSVKELFSRQVAKTRHFITTPKIIKNIIIGVVVIACFIYLGAAFKKTVSPPLLSLESPRENLTTDKKSINIIGRAEAESQITINGKQIMSDIEGNFSELVKLKEGINIITVTAKKKYGQENTIKRQILVKDEQVDI